MFTSIIGTEQETTEQVPRSSPPWVWVGFLFAGAFFIIEIAFVVLGLDETGINLILTLIVIGGWVYFTICVYRIHKILNELTHNRYPYTPGEAAGRHYIPFYNLVWLFRWPAELSNYINGKGRVRTISGGVIGTLLLLAVLVRLVDGAFGMAFLFGVMMYVSHKVKQHVKAVKGITPDQLPPLPDPRIFSRPIESSTQPAPEVVKEPSAG
jgi:hypothetical protein